jgi:multisubunit Na+/H+ antiporter MnhB subunit
MPHNHGIDNSNVRFRRNSIKLYFGTPILEHKYAVCSVQIVGVSVYIVSRADSNDGNGMMAMMVMAMMIVLVIMMIVPESLRQVDSVCQRLCQTFHKLTDWHCPKPT